MGTIVINRENEVCFHNNVDYCVGTGRMGLALTKEYMDQLKLVQDEIGFSFIRGHGLFSDDMAIYHEYEENGVTKVEYNYTYLDRVFDQYLEVGIRPYLELGFMPDKLASGKQTIFYWKGNTTPPKDYSLWCDMVKSLLIHLMDRYGKEEVLSWPIEVWNEPNLPGFWEKADMEEYFKLFHNTFDAIKSIDKRFKVGGPAVCGGTDEKWISAFMKYCHENELAIDCVTRHHYTVELPEPEGHYAYHKMMKAEDGFNNLKTTRAIIDSFDEYRGLPINITEFNTSYTPQGVIHDTNMNAAFLAQQLSRLGDVNESYSYWTFGDVFEEMGVPFTPFHGGFGLVANGCIPKPTFWTFAFYKQLKKLGGVCRYRDEDIVIMETDNGGFAGIAWNTDHDTAITKNVELMDVLCGQSYSMIQKIVDEDTCNPLKLWHDLGENPYPSKEQIRLLQDASKPLINSCVLKNTKESLSVEITINKNGVVFFEIKPVNCKPDRGYNYEKVVSYR